MLLSKKNIAELKVIPHILPLNTLQNI